MTTKTVPMFVDRKNEAYCQRCLEGMVYPTDNYTLRERERDECINCHGEHTPVERDYWIPEWLVNVTYTAAGWYVVDRQNFPLEWETTDNGTEPVYYNTREKAERRAREIV